LVIVIYLNIFKSSDLKITTQILKFFFSILLTLSVSIIIFASVNFDILSYLQTPKKSHILPFNFQTNYHLLSPSHILDLVNLLFLVCPFGCLVLCFLFPKPTFKSNSQFAFLLTATCFPFAAIAVANPEIGFFRDWDAFSFFAIPCTMASFYLLQNHCETPKSWPPVGNLFVLSACLHTLLWVGININEQKSIQRFEAILKTDTVPPIATAFSWETLGIYYRNNNQTDQAQTAYLNAHQKDPKNPRYLNALGTISLNKNDIDNALYYFRKSLVINPNLAASQANIGNIFFQQSLFDSAKSYYEQAIRNGLSDPQLYNQLSATYQALGNAEKANDWLLKSQKP